MSRSWSATSARSAPGDALLLVSVEADFGAGKTTLPGARLYLIDDSGKISVEQVVFMIPD